MINQLLSFTTYLFIFLFPLFSLPFTADSYEYNKMFLLFGFDLLLFFLLSLKWIANGKITIERTLFDIPLFLLAGITVISTLFQSPNITVALTTPLGTGTIIASFFLYFFLTQSIKEEGKDTFFLILTIDALLIACYTLLLYIGILPTSLFTPAGALPATAIFLGIVSVYLAIKTARDRTIFYTLSFFVTVCTAIFITIHLFTDQKPSLLPFQFGWAILLEILKNIRTLSLGIGPTNFITAFTLGKPALINASSVWNIIFTTSSSFFVTLTSETGLFAGILYIVILIKTINSIRNRTTHNSSFIYYVPLAALLIVLMILPANMTLFIFLIVLLAFTQVTTGHIDIPLFKVKVFNYILTIPVVLLIAIIGYLIGRVYMGEFIFKESLDALVNNQGAQAHRLQQTAINLNPYLDRYHLVFSKTNLALANALAGKKTLTEEEKQALPRLTQLAITEARNAVILYRTNVINWDNLGRTYAGLANFAAGSQNWAIQSFEQRLTLDPLNPAARLSLGAYYLALNEDENAEFLVRQAITLKDDYANAHYYLAQILVKQKKYKEAYGELQITVALLPASSGDSQKVVAQMNEIAKILPESDVRREIPQKNGEGKQKLEDIASPSGLLQSVPSVSPIEVPAPPVE